MTHITLGEVSRKLEVSEDTIRRWAKKGLIKSYRDDRNRRIFSIDEVTRIKSRSKKNNINRYQILRDQTKTKYSSVELFAGAGGTALGFENAGINHILLNELDTNASLTLKNNRPDWNVIAGDVKDISFKEGQCDIVQGGFPCQAFSYAGRSKGFEDTRGTLFFEFARCIKEIKPKIAVAENVRGLLRHEGGKTLDLMLNVLKDLGYVVRHKLLRAQYLDVPQKRERLIIMAVRKDLDIPILFPKEKDYIISLKEALEKCPESDGYEYPEYKRKVLELVPPGGYWKDLPIDVQKSYMKKSFYLGGGKTGMARRLAWDEPTLTLTCSPAQKQTERCHPEHTRPLRIREYARIQTFPDDWKFEGSISSRYKQIGNAVPVNLAYHVAKATIHMLNGVTPDDFVDVTKRNQSLFSV